MLNKRSFMAILAAAILTAACTAPAPVEKGVGLVAKGYQITDVNVVLAKDAAVGRFKKDPALTKKTVQSIDNTLTAELVKPRGNAKKAKLSVEITKMELRSAVGRTLVAVENQIVANVVARDSKNQIIAAEQVFFAKKGAQNQSTFNGIPVGFMVSALVNSAKSGAGNDVGIIVDGFNGKVLKWVAR